MHMSMEGNLRKRGFVLAGFATVLLATTASAIAQNSEQKSPVFSVETAKWNSPYDGPLGIPKGAQAATLGIDPVTGGETYYARFPAGSHFELHWHTHDEHALVVSGKGSLTLGAERHSLAEGNYVVIPGKVPHEWNVDARRELILLVRRAGPTDFNFVKDAAPAKLP